MIYQQPHEVTIIPGLPPLLSGPLFTKLETCPKRVVVLQGGGDALKTGAVLQWLAVKCIQNKNTQVTISGVDIPNLKRGAIRLFKKYIQHDPQIEPFIKSYNSTDRELIYTNSSKMIFSSFLDASDARGAENDYVFMNEANLQAYDLFWELQRKCRGKVILDYNPTFAFWAHAKLIPKSDGTSGEKQFTGQVQRYIVDHRHNPFLTEQEHENYENISDPERFQVYARGMTGKTKGAIFNFKKVDKVPLREVVNEDGTITSKELEFGFGIDIGYTTDKTAIIKVWMQGKDHYYKGLLYKSNDEIQNEINENGLIGENGQVQTVEGYIKKILVENGCTMSTNIWGDHDKNISTKLRRIGIPYRMAKKGPNSVAASISSVKRFNGHYIDTPELETEMESYVWETAVDILTGSEITTGVPIDGMPDHYIAAIRMYENSYAMRFSG